MEPPLKIVQELMRHANISTTMELYVQGDVAAKRLAQGVMSELFLVKREASLSVHNE